MRTVADLLLTIGVMQLTAKSDDDLERARLVGVGTAATLAAVDLRYAPTGRISRVYLLDALAQCG